MKKLSVIAVAVLITAFAVSPSYAIFGGIGLHWGYDLSMSMDDVSRENLNLGLPVTIPGVDPMYVSRMNWKNSAVNFGGKVFLEFIPYFESLELSCNFGLWQYDGALHVLSNSAEVIAGVAEPVYKPIDLTLKNTDLSYVGLSGTPYAKLHFDATLRKEIVDFWVVKLSGGAGLSAHFATPLLSNKIVESALGSTLSSIDPDMLLELADPTSSFSKSVAKKIVQEIIDEALGKPVIGGHLLLGVKAKLPAVPVGIYVDGKLMFPFNKFEKDASKVSGFGTGFLLNMGISLSI